MRFHPNKFALLLLLLLWTSCQSNSSQEFARRTWPALKIALLDTPTCQPKSYSKFGNVTVHHYLDFTKSHKTKDCKMLPKFKRSLHGHFILMTLLNELDIKNSIDILPLVVFNKKGKSSLDAWKQALDFVKEHQVDIILTASGHIIDSKGNEVPPSELPTLSFSASGQVGRGIKKTTKVWPQSLKSKNQILVGSYIRPRYPLKNDLQIFFANNLYPEKIELVFDNGNKRIPLRGSSRAVAVALARSINHCEKDFFIKEDRVENVRKCISKRSLPVLYEEVKWPHKTLPPNLK